jgi:predicted Zn-dependent protease
MRALPGLGLVLMLGACANPEPLPDLAPGERPAAGSEEAGLWMQADRAEEAIRTSSLRITDPGLVGYVQEILDRLAGPQAKDLRLYILEIPEFNAFAFPNGALVVLSGLVLRAENESQLAFVLGHEITHYQKRHSVLLYLSARSKSGFAAFFQTFANAVLVGDVGSLVGSLAAGTVYRFSRDQERDADEGGVGVMAKGGYDSRESARICEICLAESEASGRKDQATFFASHPTTQERITTLSKRAAREPVAVRKPAPDRHSEVLRPLRLGFLKDEVRRNDPAGLQVLLDQLFLTGINPGELHFIQGEVFRLRRGKDDVDLAIASYRNAVEHPPAPPEAHQMLGILYLKKGEKANARASLTRYLELNPKAGDAEMIRSYLKQLD